MSTIKNLNKAAKQYCEEIASVDIQSGAINGSMRTICSYQGLKAAFEAGAQWQKTQKPDLQQLWEQSIQLDGFYTFDEAQEKCPKGYRVPTFAEWAWLIDNTEYSFDEEKGEGVFLFADGAELRLPAAGVRYDSSGSSNDQGTRGYDWSSSVSGTSARDVCFNSGTVYAYASDRAYAFSVRCLPIEIK